MVGGSAGMIVHGHGVGCIGHRANGLSYPITDCLRPCWLGQRSGILGPEVVSRPECLHADRIPTTSEPPCLGQGPLRPGRHATGPGEEVPGRSRECQAAWLRRWRIESSRLDRLSHVVVYSGGARLGEEAVVDLDLPQPRTVEAVDPRNAAQHLVHRVRTVLRLADRNLRHRE